MRILHIEDYFDPTAGYQINELLYASKNFDDEVFLITSTDMSPFHKKVDIKKDREFEEKTGVKIYRLDPILKISSRLLLNNFRKTIKKINPDIIFMHGIGDFKDLQLWGRKKKYKIVRDCHMSWVASKNKFRNIFYLFYKIFFASIINRTDKYEVIYALGEEEYEYLKKIGIKDHKIDFLRHGFNDSIMYFDEKGRKEIRSKYKFNEEDVVIAYIGKFNNSKRPDLIIDVIDNLDKRFIDDYKVKLLFIGPKEDTYIDMFNKKLEKIAKKIPVVLDESKPFTELRKYYSASDICIFPKETTLSSIHAQVCGCSVIMEKYKSNIERVIDSRNLYDIDNLYEAACILERIIKNNEHKENKKNMQVLFDREYKKQIIKFRSRALK
ncbi:D-inositol-3-phosphate glycosyltransferase [Caloramator mitchellensis]|uniref:D-inositol-3-phosphate glycosyltransferase n=1 Tax=Caloramator mitchellensis TaxID=908809 RepID=A0A0R3JQW2_CALMK|nr:glycosyltransferase family 4 protein [Caloramator mitchellensis]KRQ85841.1 D-inositol-3-phosphate glycosyltransferase [Caloramator mitchellensis]